MLHTSFGRRCWTAMAGSAACLTLIHAAHAQSLPSAPHTTSVNRVLAGATPLGDAALSHLRGGYELAPGVTAYFAFSQTVMLDGKVLQTIVVPQIEISATQSSGTILVGGGSGNTVVTSGSGTPQTVGDTTSPPVAFPFSVGNGNIAVVSTANSGQTITATNFAGTGLAEQIANTANNAAISTATSVNIATSGMPSFIQTQRSSATLTNDLQLGSAAIP